jgi:hypothetical protein
LTRFYETIEALKVIAVAQQKCADVELSIGTVHDGQVVHGGVYIKDCPATVIEALQEAGFVLDMNDGKLAIVYRK